MIQSETPAKERVQIDIFERRELKYMMTPEQYAIVRKAVEANMNPDVWGESTICNVYFDTPDWRLIRRSIEKPLYKEKLRLRSYGQVPEDREVFIELKKKFNKIVYKRRTGAPEKIAFGYMAGENPLPKNGQIEREIQYFKDFYLNLIPAMHVNYFRTAFFAKDDPSLRVTFDRNLCWRTTDLRLSSPPGGRLIVPAELTLMEIKLSKAIPLWLVNAISEAGVRRKAFSKYGTAYTTLMRETRGK